MTSTLSTTMQELTAMQRKAVDWDNGPLLVLAGPGSGKTSVLTCRIARLLETSRDERFRILGLTFTNKAAHEMRTRVEALVPDVSDRAEVSTFHGFCAQLLRQHGAHLGIKPNFEIYSQTADRQAVLEDALQRQANCSQRDDNQLLPRIDALKERLVGPEQAMSYLQRKTCLSSDVVKRIGLAYQLYEQELGRSNALDFNSLIRLAFELLKHPALAQHYQTIYRYWLIDEFQDTNGPQYKLLRQMAGDNFRQLFAVADDDQTIYEWNGANVHRIRSLVDDFGCEVIQLTENFRCPPSIVEAANRLVVYNVQRDLSKAVAEPATRCTETKGEIKYNVFSDDKDEAFRIAEEVAILDAGERTKTVVLARSRSLLEPIQSALGEFEVPVTLLGRRNDFASPQMRWFVALLKQINRPLDQRNVATLTETFRSFAGVQLEVEEVVTLSETNQVTLLAAWLDAVQEAESSSLPVIQAAKDLAAGSIPLPEAVVKLMKCFKSEDEDRDLQDDKSAWRRIESEIRYTRGTIPLDQFLQEMELRSKEPTPVHGAVSLGTVHGAKGLEFDRVYLIGLAEEVFPSWYSVKKSNGYAAIEEERRSCFVAITRTKRHLVLSRAHRYKEWPKQPSRFLKEMGLLDQTVSP